MKLEFSLLRTRVARRMLMLFLLCALVPIVTLAIIIYPVVVNRVEAARVQQLHDDAKGAGMLILARFERFAGMLQWGEVHADSLGAGSPFTGLASEAAGGRVRVLRGRIGTLPVLDSVRSARLATGNPVLVVSRDGGTPGVYLVVRSVASTGGFPRTWGYFAAGTAIAGTELVRGGIGLCIEDQQGPLACNGAGDSLEVGVTQLTRRWPMFLKSEFGAPAWTITVTQRRADALAPLAEFRRTFFLGLIFAVILVFVLSHVHIRRRMTPLADLETGTRRLRDGDFSSRVVIESDDEFQSLGIAFNQMATDLERQFTTLSALQHIDQAALRDHSTGSIAAAVLRDAPALLHADVVAIATAGPVDCATWRIELVTQHDLSARLEDVEISPGDIRDLAAADPCIIVADSDRAPPYCDGFVEHGCRELIVFPIHGQRGPMGALIVGFHAPPLEHRTSLLATGRQLAEQLCLGLSNVSLLEELDSLSLGALTALARTIDASSHWTAGHSERVTELAVEIAGHLGFSGEEIVRLRQGSLLHDIGKIGVPPAILDKAGPLTAAELAVMQSHPAIGARIIESVRAFRDLVPLVLHHHELLDGTGYPAGLRDDEIPQLVRVLTVADIFDALTSDRPYRKGLSVDAAVAILVNGVDVKFDRAVVEALREMVAAQWTPSGRHEFEDGAGLSERDGRMLIGVGDSEWTA